MRQTCKQRLQPIPRVRSHFAQTASAIRSAASRIAIALLAVLALAAPLGVSTARAQDALSIGIDADPAGNGPTSLGDIQTCRSVQAGDTFDVDVFIRHVDELLAWQVYLRFDPDILQVVGRDVDMFLGANPGSFVFDASSGQSPADPSLYEASAADTSDPPTPDSGSGVLVRLSLRALSEGTSDLELVSLDFDGDGQADIGPLLRNADTDVLGDEDGDTIFDGPVSNAEVSVGEPCADGSSSSNSGGNSDGSGISLGVVVGVIAGAGIVLGAGGYLVLRLRRLRAASR